MSIIRDINATLALLQDNIIRDYQKTRIIIDLIFITISLVNKLIYCKINNKIKNFSNYVLVKTILNFDLQQELSRRFRRK